MNLKETVEKILISAKIWQILFFTTLISVGILSFSNYMIFIAYQNKKPDVIYVTPEGIPVLASDNDGKLYNPSELKYIGTSFTFDLLTWNNDTIHTNINNATSKFCTQEGTQAVGQFIAATRIETIIEGGNSVQSDVQIKDIVILEDKKLPYEIEIKYTQNQKISNIDTHEQKIMAIQLVPVERTINSIIGYKILNFSIRDDK